MSTATDATLIALGERFEKLLLEHMDAWLTWAPRMRAARAEVRLRAATRSAGRWYSPVPLGRTAPDRHGAPTSGDRR
jgi:hypothetical protein